MITRGVDVAVDALLFAIGLALIFAPVGILIALAWGARWRVRFWWTRQVASLSWRRERREYAGYAEDEEPF